MADFRIADTFTDSIAHLTGDAHNTAKKSTSDVQLNPPDRGMVFELFSFGRCATLRLAAAKSSD